MYEVYAGNARQAVLSAQRAAESRGRLSVGTSDLLTGILETGSLEAAAAVHRVLTACGTSAASLADELPRPGDEDDEVAGGYGVPMNRLADAVLHHAVEEAQALDDWYIGSHHLLLGLLREPDGVGGRYLRDAGVHLAAARHHAAEVDREHREGRARRGATPPEPWIWLTQPEDPQP
jgi:ATP-dependent Clp protease ATP-binding subunit ClpC